MDEIKTIWDLLGWLAGAGSVILVSWAVSWGLEGWKVWESLTAKFKSLVILLVAILLGVLATWLQTRPELLEVVAPYAATIIAIVIAWLATQVAHKANKGLS